MPLLSLYKSTFLLSVAGLLSSLAGIAANGAYPNIFGWLFFYMPFLWVLWICCLFFARGEKPLFKLLFLWLIIDLAILALFISFAIRVNNWSQTRGIEIVVFIAYSPLVIPTGFLVNFVPKVAYQAINHAFDSLGKGFGGGVGDAFAIWLCMSGAAAVQSFWLFGLSRFLMRKKWGKNQSES